MPEILQGHAGAIIAILVILLAGALAGLWRAARHCRKLDRDADVLARTNGTQAILPADLKHEVDRLLACMAEQEKCIRDQNETIQKWYERNCALEDALNSRGYCE